MKIIADPSVLVRALMGDDEVQGPIAQAELAKTELVALAIPALCELVRILPRGYKIAVVDIAQTIGRLINSRNVAMNRPAAEAGLAMLAAGGDLADGVIAYEGAWLGASSFVSFNPKAVSLLQTPKTLARLLE